eukprot:4397042-Amphidinium_carterae.2
MTEQAIEWRSCHGLPVRDWRCMLKQQEAYDIGDDDGIPSQPKSRNCATPRHVEQESGGDLEITDFEVTIHVNNSDSQELLDQQAWELSEELLVSEHNLRKVTVEQAEVSSYAQSTWWRFAEEGLLCIHLVGWPRARFRLLTDQ